MADQQRDEHTGQHAMGGEGRRQGEIGQRQRRLAAKLGTGASEQDRGDAARHHDEDHGIESEVNHTGRHSLGARGGRLARRGVHGQPPDDAEHGQGADDDARDGMDAQQDELAGRIGGIGRCQARAQHGQDGDGGQPVDGDDDGTIAVGTASEHGILLATCRFRPYR